MHRLLLTLLIGFAPLAKAESALPDCPADQSLRFHNCFGTYIAGGQKYVGEWKDDKKHGQGTATWPDGQKYVGEWKDDKKHGQGTHTWPNGQKYVGEYKDDKFHGQGTATFPDGDKWSGYYMNGEYVPNICSNMGLTKGSPEHGQCVLKLMDSVMSEEE